MNKLLRELCCTKAATFSFLFVLCLCGLNPALQAQCEISFPAADDISVNCGEAIPAFAPCEAGSTCCQGPVNVVSFESETGAIQSDCILSTAFGPGPDWAFWLPDFQGLNVSWNFVGTAHLQVYADGTARLWGTIANAANPSLTFNADLWFDNARNWTDWSALGRSYKDDFGIAAGQHVNWTYFELADGFATLTGTGALAGSYLHLHHKPANYFYGFQLGMAANNKNTNPGFSGWFTYDGMFQGQQVTGHGDVNVDKSCTETPDQCASTAYTRVCRATDSCGNFAFSSQTIFVNDDNAPVVENFEPVISLDCFNYDGIFITAVDNCSIVNISYTDEIIEPGCGGQLIRHYTVSDGCGNTVMVSQTINLIGEQPPYFTVFPEDIEIECDQVDQLVMPEVEWVNGCGNTSLAITSEIIQGICANSYDIVYTYSLTDACENLVSQNWTIHVTDTTAPVLFNIPADIVINCGDEIAATNVFALDNCDENPNVTLEAVTVQGTCGYEFIRTWTATDACGNSVSASQTITVQDNVDPVFDFVPQTLFVNCGDNFEVEDAIASDACSPFELTWTDQPLQNCAGGFIRLWTATDGCGNTASASTTVNIVDNIPPTIVNGPENITVNCNEVPTAESAEIEYYDNCGSVTVDFFEDIISNEDCPGSYNVERLWIYTDECGNRSDYLWIIHVSDLQAPVIFGVPENETLNCGQEPAEAVVFAIDNCDPEVLVTLEATTEQTECGYNFIRTWTATDDCGNTSTATQTIAFTDNEPPVFTFIPENINLACSSESNLDNIELAEASDDCSVVEVTYSDTPLGGNCGDGILRTFTATDGCGNSITAEQFISFSDEVAPVFTFVPESVLAECGSDVMLDMAEATDNCSGVTVTFTDAPAGGCAGSFIRTYTAMDGCGNTATAEVSVIFSDNIPPVVINAPMDVTVNCNEVPTAESANLEFFDNCGSVEYSFNESTVDGDGCPGSYVIIRTWTLQDECGNETEVVWTINVSDFNAPQIIGVPENQTLSCGENPAEAVVVAIDNCDPDVQVELSAQTIPNECGYTFIRTWTASDACGNHSAASQTIEFFDNEDPFFTYVPAAATLVCSNNGGLPTNDIAIASDNCSEVVVTYEDIPGEQGCVDGVTRIWTATDACGNTATATTEYSLQDEIAPQFVLFPEDVAVLNCVDVPSVESAVVTYTDNCSSVSVDFSEVITPLECAGSSIIERTWTITDACGNSSSATWTIYALDEQVPQIVGVPASTTISCGEQIQDVQVFATDNCTPSDEIIITLNAETINIECGYIFRRTWIATDACGNSSEAVQDITVIDQESPTFLDYPETISLVCGVEQEIAPLVAVDACSSVTYTITETPIAGCIPGVIRTTVATDECGNSTTAVQTITTTDTQAPMPSVIPTDIQATCDNVPVITVDDITFTDNCSAVDVSFATDITEGSCAGEYTIDYIWIAQDACGNRIDLMQTVHVTPAPLGMTNLPDDLVISCSDPIPAIVYPTATGGCNQDIQVNVEVTTLPGNCPGSSLILRRFYIEDDCDQTFTHFQFIQVIDNQPPVFEPFETQISLPCSQSSGVFVVATDACTSVQISYTDQQIGGGCGSTIQRTYTALDACGNSSTAIQYISLTDEIAPQVVSFPADADADCSNIPSITSANIVATDNCSNVFISSVEEIIAGDCANSYTILRTFLIEDLCGNSVTRVWTINVSDNTAPQIIGVPEDMTIECTDDIPSVNPIAVDNCTAVPALSIEANTIFLDCGYQFIRTWTAIDECGNISTATQTITVSDFTAPVLSEYPADLELPCGTALPEAPFIFAEDNCQGLMDVTMAENSVDASPCGTVTRTWCVTDCAGNETCHTQTITFTNNNGGLVQQNTAPKNETTLAVYRSSRNQLNINANVEASGNWRIDVYDITGRLVIPVYSGYMESGPVIPFTVDPASLSDELYFIRLTNGEKTITRKMVIAD